ncbi:triose phosphate/phosphate translocator, chloroplastic-like protein [Tanacetum coccineum]|uniref:Triose phosphate/phosphate translocator, chloroplastic-like protein n=1 Tax=Tanacetum coccineum TaxID=301880 RepID=A0ABQ5C4A7_9ASTR
MSPLSHHGGFAVCCTQKHPYFIKKSSPSLPLPRSQVMALALKRSTDKIPVDFLGKQMRFGWGPLLRVRGSVHFPLIKAAAAEAKPLHSDADVIRVLVTGFIFVVIFVSAVHLLVSVACYFYSWSMGFLQIAPIDMDLLKVIAPAAVCHAIGHVFSNISILALCWSSAQSSRAMEPLITVVGSQLVLGQRIPLALWMSLAHVVIGLIEILNWADRCDFLKRVVVVFTSEIIATLSLSFRNTLSKKAMKRLESRNVQVYMSIIALFFCLPAAICIDGPKMMQYGFKDAVAKKGMVRFMYELLIPGLLYHLHNKVVITTLERVTPITQSVANVLIRVLLIALLPFGGKVIATQSKIGAGIAVYGALGMKTFLVGHKKLSDEVEKLKNAEGTSHNGQDSTNHHIGSPHHSGGGVGNTYKKGTEDAWEEIFEECTNELFTQDSPIGFVQDVSPQISIHALSSVTSYRTLRIRGYVGKQVMQNICPLKVDVADGNSLTSSFMCKDFKWTLQGLPFVTDMMLTMEFEYGKSKVLLRGTPQTSVQWMQGKGSKKKGSEAMLNSMTLCVYPPTLFAMEESEQGIAKHPCKAVEDLLIEYADVFSMPNALPPKISHDHQIPLLPNTSPINIRPYRHPANQKDAIELMVKELLDSRVIRPSQSPFSSSIVMVKKKDGSWRMCIDYRQLNKHIIKYKFPIPMIEELIDELQVICTDIAKIIRKQPKPGKNEHETE